jgi:hypothetical protein
LWTDALGNQDAANPRNWLNYDTLQPVPMPPVTGDDLYFDGNYFLANPALNPNCQGLHAMPGYGPDRFNYVQMINGYSGTVTIGDDASGGLSINNLNLTSGTIAQPDPGLTDLTVLTSFDWTGGTLNSSSNLANLNISGSTTTATIAPANAGTINLGDNINLLNGAVATMNAGTINVTNDNVEWDIGDPSNSWCVLNMAPGDGKNVVITGTTTNNGIMKIGKNDSVNVLSGTWTYQGRIENAGGTFTLQTGSTATVTKGANAPQYYQGSGSSFLYSGSTLQLGMFGMVIFAGGTLQTVNAGTGTDAAIIRPGQGGFFNFDAGDIYINSSPSDPGSHSEVGTLEIDGSVQWTGGTYHPRVPAEHDGWSADLWYATGTFSISKLLPTSPGPVLAPIALDDEDNVVPPPSGSSWLVIQADQGITIQNNNPNLPSVDANNWLAFLDGNPTTRLLVAGVFRN